MNDKATIIGTILVGVGTWLVAHYIRTVTHRHHKRVAKKLAREAYQTWEGEGGALIDTAART